MAPGRLIPTLPTEASDIGPISNWIVEAREKRSDRPNRVLDLNEQGTLGEVVDQEIEQGRGCDR